MGADPRWAMSLVAEAHTSACGDHKIHIFNVRRNEVDLDFNCDIGAAPALAAVILRRPYRLLFLGYHWLTDFILTSHWANPHGLNVDEFANAVSA